MRRGIAIACGLALSAVAHAETLSLEQALQRALTNDPRIEEKQQLVEAARRLQDEVLGHGDWLIDLNAFVGLAPALDGGLFDAGSCTPGPCTVRDDRYEVNGLSPWLNMQLTVIKPLYTFGKIENYSDAAQANVDVKQGDTRLQRGEIALDVKRAYYGYLAARDSRLLLEDVRKRITDAVTLVQSWLDSGEVSVKQSDLYALQAGEGLVGRYIAQAQGLERVALDGLKVLTGIGLGGELQTADTRIAPLDLPALELPALTDRALAQRPEMAQVDAGLRALRALVEAHKAEAKPNLYAGIGGLLSYSPNRDRLDNPYISDAFNDMGLTPMVGLKWNWQKGVQGAQVARAQSELSALTAKSALARQGIPFQVAEQYHQVQAHYEAVQRLDEASSAARRWMVTTYADFEAGLEQADKVMAAFQGYVLARSDYLHTVFDYNMHVAQLQHVTGVDQ